MTTRGPTMKKKTKPVCKLQTILDAPITELSLEKLIGTQDAVSSAELQFNKEVLQDPPSLHSICAEIEALDDENSMEDFIDKYSSSTFTSLDELLTNHTARPYEFQVKASSSDKLFEGLDGLFDD